MCKNKYHTIFFDADDTLFDFQKSEEVALRVAFTEVNYPDIQLYLESYRRECARLWKLYEEKKITQSYLRVERFRFLKDKFSLNIDADLLALRYINELPRNVFLLEGAELLCQELSKNAELIIVTNGVTQVQEKRLQASPINEFISFMITSEECGFAKPDVRILELAASRVKKFQPECTLMVGDRLEADVRVAFEFGVDSCWFNPRGEVSSGLRPTFEVKDLGQLARLLL